MSTIGDLVVGSPEVSTTLAEQYFVENNQKFEGYLSSENFILDNKNNEVYISNVPDDIDDVSDIQWCTSNKATSDSKGLVQGIEEKSKLLCQLEYSLRRLPIEHIQKDIDLLIDIISRKEIVPKDVPECCINLDERGSLSVAFAAVDQFPDVVFATPNTAAVGHLLVSMCKDNGLPTVLVIAKDNKLFERITTDTTRVQFGCTAVVADKSDMDSAVDAIASAVVTTYPWRLNRVLVQESAYQRFVRTLQWRAERTRTHTTLHDYRPLCRDRYVCGDKVFACDYLGYDPLPDHVIQVEAYRTNKELLDTLGTPFCVSLWSSDVAEANEIAFNARARLVWINDYAILDYPSASAFSPIDSYKTNRLHVKKSAVLKLEDDRREWLKLPLKKRKQVLLDCEMFAAGRVRDVIWNWKSRSFSGIHDSRSYVGSEDVADIYVGKKCRSVDVARALLAGAGVIYGYERTASPFSMPIAYLEEGDVSSDKSGDCVELPLLLAGTENHFKIVWTSFGTIFAN